MGTRSPWPVPKTMIRVLTIAFTFLVLALVFLYQPTTLSPGHPTPTPTPHPHVGQTRPYYSAQAGYYPAMPGQLAHAPTSPWITGPITQF
ncbi:MAG: hypothetical protein ACJ78Q_12985 [Chloroflexia bacterium]